MPEGHSIFTNMPEDQLPNPAGMSEVGIPLIAPMRKDASISNVVAL